VAYIHKDKSEPFLCYLSSGTKQYLAPEVFTKSHAHGPAADYWSLGIMLYELLFSRRPFEKHCPLSYIRHLDDIERIHNVDIQQGRKVSESVAEISSKITLLADYTSFNTEPKGINILLRLILYLKVHTSRLIY